MSAEKNERQEHNYTSFKNCIKSIKHFDFWRLILEVNQVIELFIVWRIIAECK